MNILSKNIDFEVAGVNHHAYLAYDDIKSEPRPGILVFHEWWGLNDYMIQRVNMLAELGYVACAIDLYGDGQLAETPADASKLKYTLLSDMDATNQLLKQAHQLLLDQPGVDATATAAIGYCLGGSIALHMARIGVALSAVTTFHASFNSFHTAKPGSIKPEILVCHGAADSMVSMASLEAFKAEMKLAQANAEILILDDAKHGFTNRQSDENAEKYALDLGYQQKADQQSWAGMLNLFERVF